MSGFEVVGLVLDTTFPLLASAMESHKKVRESFPTPQPRFNKATTSNDISLEAMKLHIQKARREAETLKDLVARKKKELTHVPNTPNRPRINNNISLWIGDTSSFFEKTVTKALTFKRKAIRVLVNGKECFARPDTGSEKDIMSEAFEIQHNIPINRAEKDRGLFKLGSGNYIKSIGRAFVPCSLLSNNDSEERRWFHVLSKCAVPLIMGMGFLQKIKLYTRNQHLLEDYPAGFGSMPTLKWIGSPQGRLPFLADGRDLVGCADTGSDLDFMSFHCAIKRGFKIDGREVSRTRVMHADGSITETVGTVAISSLKIGHSQFNDMDTIFHVLPGLPCDVIFGEEFLETMDAFNRFSHIMDIREDDLLELNSLNTLINLGPIQAFFNRKWRPAADDTEQKIHDDVIEAEIYRRHKSRRDISRMFDDEKIRTAKVVEERIVTAFDRGHENCIHCFGQVPRPGDEDPTPAINSESSPATVQASSVS